MGRIRAIGHRRELIGVIAVAALALAACMPTNPPRPPVPVAAFSVSIAPLVASFTDQSTGVINSRSWDFGDGQTSTEQSPTHTYATHGVYPVSLTVTGPGGTNTTGQDVTVNPPAPVASFTAEPPSGTVPLTVLLTSASTGLVDSVAWDLDADGVFDDADRPDGDTDVRRRRRPHRRAVGDGTRRHLDGQQGDLGDVAAAALGRAQGPTDFGGGHPCSCSLNGCASAGEIAEVRVGLRQRRDGRRGPGRARRSTPSTHPAPSVSPCSSPDPVARRRRWRRSRRTCHAPVAAFNAAPSTGTAPLTVQFNDTSSGAITSRAWTIGNETNLRLRRSAQPYIGP